MEGARDKRDTITLSSGVYQRLSQFEFRHGTNPDCEVVAKRLKAPCGLWRAYECEHIWGYSHLHGGQTHHATVRVLRDLNGDPIQATTREELERLLDSQPFIRRVPGERSPVA